MRTRFLSGIRILKELSKALVFFFIFIVVIPVVVGMVENIPPANILSYIASTFILQAAAPPLGGPLGISRMVILVIMASFAVGIILVILELCKSLALTSRRVSGWIENIGKQMEKYPVTKKYGAISCILIAWIPGIGLYGTPIIAWILGWNRILTILFTTIGFVIAAAFVLFVATSIHDVQDVILLILAAAAVLLIVLIIGKVRRKKG